MASRPDHPLAIYPMVEEAEAVGRVAAVYAQVLDRMPMVPSLLKSLAVCPGYLELAWAQLARALQQDGFDRAAEGLGASVARATPPVPDRDARATVARFVAPLGRMLLATAGLWLAARGALDVPGSRPAEPSSRPMPSRPLRGGVPSQWELGEIERFGAIRAALDTPIVNSIWRKAAAEGQLATVWAHLAPHARSTRSDADALQQRAIDEARAQTWPVVASTEAMAAAGLVDVQPAVTCILDAYLKTLPRVLVLVASNAAHG